MKLSLIVSNRYLALLQVSELITEPILDTPRMYLDKKASENYNLVKYDDLAGLICINECHHCRAKPLN